MLQSQVFCFWSAGGILTAQKNGLNTGKTKKPVGKAETMISLIRHNWSVVTGLGTRRMILESGSNVTPCLRSINLSNSRAFRTVY